MGPTESFLFSLGILFIIKRGLQKEKENQVLHKLGSEDVEGERDGGQPACQGLRGDGPGCKASEGASPVRLQLARPGLTARVAL